MVISSSVAVMQCILAIGEKGRVRNQKLYVPLVAPGSSAGVQTPASPERHIVFDSLPSFFHL